MISGYRVSAVLHVAARLHLADAIGDAIKDSRELAKEANAHAPTLMRILRALAVLGLTEELETDRFRLTSLGALLRSDAPESLASFALSGGGEESLRVWGHLLHTARTGETTFDHVRGMTSFEYFAQNPEIGAGFNTYMAEGTRLVAPAIIASCDFSRFRRIVDVGGGNGTLLAAILKASPAARGVLFDMPTTASGEHEPLETVGVDERCEIVAGDFFEAVPEAGDCYLLKHIIHDWTDELCVTILDNVHRAMAPNAHVLLIEGVLPPTVDASNRTRMLVMADIKMLVNTGGRERTEAEFAALLSDSRLRLSGVTPIEAPYPICAIEAVAD
jgi:hypothetical protein